MKNEDLISIGKNIKQHRDDEIRFSPQYIATARANCTIAMGNIKRSSIVWLATTKNSRGIERQADNGDEITIEKVEGAEIDEAEFISDFESDSEVNENE